MDTMMVRKERHNKKIYVKNNVGLYLMLVPGMLSLFIFTFVPMYGFYMAFVDYSPSVPLFQSENVGGLWFKLMFEDPLLWKMVRNTLIISSMKIFIMFPLTIVLALLINELELPLFKKIFQSVSYLPNFISWIIISGMMVIFLDSDNGILNQLIQLFGGKPVSWYSDPNKWYVILLLTNMWKNIGWGTIVYIAGFSAIDTQLYEAAKIDGAGRFRQAWSITLPAISPIISITLILTVGKIFQDDFEQIYALVGENDILAETTAVISTKIYQYASTGRYDQFPISTAMGLVQGIVSFLLIALSNMTAKKLGYESLW